MFCVSLWLVLSQKGRCQFVQNPTMRVSPWILHSSWFKDSRATSKSFSRREPVRGGWNVKKIHWFAFKSSPSGSKITLMGFMFSDVLLGRQSFSRSASTLQFGSTGETFVFFMSHSRSLFTVTAHFFSSLGSTRRGFFWREKLLLIDKLWATLRFLRLDPANRAGFFFFFSLRIRSFLWRRAL